MNYGTMRSKRRGQPLLTSPWALIVALGVIAVIPAGVQAQALGEPIPFGPAYGQSRGLFPIRQPRSLTDTRRAARLDYYQQQSTRLRRNPFRVAALDDPIAGVQARMARFRSGRAIYPSGEYDAQLGPIPIEQLEAFHIYGGFGTRRFLEPKLGDLNEALRRRTNLLEATALYAPVIRANLENASVAGLRASLDITSLPHQTRPLPDAAQVEPSALVDKFSDRIEIARTQKIDEAWAQFREGSYSRAINSFKTYAELSDDNTESEIAQVFCNVSMGAPRTAVAVLARIARSQENPFAYELNLASRYGRRVDVDILKARARFQASAARDNPALVALSAFVFWYLGEEEEARSTVAVLKTEGGGTVFADWPAKLEQAYLQR